MPDACVGVKEAGWSAEQQPVPRLRLLLDRTVSEPTPSNLQRFMSLVLAALQAQEESWPFREPVPADEVPDYYTIIKVLPLLLIHLRVRPCQSGPQKAI